jgi:hypothetical protein
MTATIAAAKQTGRTQAESRSMIYWELRQIASL